MPVPLARKLRGGSGRGREGTHRSRFRPARRGELRPGTEHLGRLRDLRKEQARRRRPCQFLLVGPRQLGRGLEGFAARRRG